MGQLLTTDEAAELARYGNRRTFVQWAKRFPGLLRRYPHRRGYLVDRAELERVLARAHLETESDSLEHDET